MATLAGSADAGSVIVDLGVEDSGVMTGAVGGDALFMRDSVQPAGTEVIDSFLHIQGRGTERGYNTDARPLEYDEKAGNFTRSLTLGEIPVVLIDGIAYREFLLDVNEENGNNNEAKKYLSLNDIRIAHGTAGDLTGEWGTGLSGTITVWVMNDGDVDALDDNGTYGSLNRVELKDINPGSGVSDMVMYIPDSAFVGLGISSYIYLYSRFGTPEVSGGGFEEWAVRSGSSPQPGPLVPVPTPTAAIGGLLLLGTVALRRK